MDGQVEPTSPVEAPLGFLDGRVDEKGRVKLPAAILQYIASSNESSLFITTFDKGATLIYPKKRWLVTRDFLEKPGERAEGRRALLMRANHFGGEAEIDSQGRALVPTTLRRELKLEGAVVHLSCVGGHIEMLSDAAYQEKLAESDRILETELTNVYDMGLP